MKSPAFIIFIILFIVSGCFPLRSIFLGKPGRKDLKRFPNGEIGASETPFNFFAGDTSRGLRLRVNDWTSDIPFFVPLDEVVASHPVRSLLIIQRDSILYQYYGRNTDENSLHSSYSIAKSFISVLIGIAIGEDLIGNESDKVIDYLPELAEIPQASELKISHLLNHTSGIKYSLTQDATIYYGKDVLKALPRIQFEHPPGKVQHYLNINVMLLGILLERATGMPNADYLSQKLWSKAGMESSAVWATDREGGREKAYCCLGATARDYARFGRLMLHEGQFNGEQIIPREWVKKSLARDTTEGSSFNYNFCWHIGLKEYGDFMANGLYKQHIYVHPEKEVIIVLLNDREAKLKAERVNWWNVFRQIVDQI